MTNLLYVSAKMIGADVSVTLEIRVHLLSFATCLKSFVLVKRYTAFVYVHYDGLCSFKSIDGKGTMY